MRKDIECVFVILKKQFVILKAFNRMSKVQNIDDVFVTCCILHNILLEADGYLKIDLPDIPYGLRNKLKIDPRGDGIWITNAGHHGRGLTMTTSLVMTGFCSSHRIESALQNVAPATRCFD